MADVRLNLFENVPVLHRLATGSLLGLGTLQLHCVEIPGSISFNNVNMIISGSGAVSENLTVSLGLYSLNGSTLSLANSASMATALTLNQTMFSWLTFATSATQDITPGNWFFGIVSATSLGAGFSFVNGNAAGAGLIYGGPFFRGWMSETTSAMPGSIATSDLVKEGATNSTPAVAVPYIVISA